MACFSQLSWSISIYPISHQKGLKEGSAPPSGLRLPQTNIQCKVEWRFDRGSTYSFRMTQVAELCWHATRTNLILAVTDRVISKHNKFCPCNLLLSARRQSLDNTISDCHTVYGENKPFSKLNSGRVSISNFHFA